MWLGDTEQEEFHKRRPHMDLGATRYPQLIDALKAEIKKEGKETYQTIQLV